LLSEEDAMRVPHGPGYIKTSADVEMRPLTQAEADAVFAVLATKGDKIPFRYIKEGCEVRSQLMIEEMVAMGIDPSLPGTHGPLTIQERAAAIKLTIWEMPATPLSQAEMLNIFATKGPDLQGFVYVVPRGVCPVTDIPGSGFRLAPDPPEGIATFVAREVQRLFKEQEKMRSPDHP
jgi:hypothetical protein